MRITCICVVFAFALSGCTYSAAAPTLAPVVGAGRPATSAVQHALLYVSSAIGHDVTVYTYRYAHAHYLTTLTSFNEPTGECVDGVGNVYITDSGNVFEYAHGAPKPLRTLQDRGGSPIGCSVDRSTGDLAVTNSYGETGSAGNVLVYRGGHGPPRKYTDADIYSPQFCAYDDSGNLFVDGFSPGSAAFRLAELPVNGRHLVDVPISGGTLHYPAGVFWESPNVFVADQRYQSQAQSAIFVLSVANERGQVVRVVPLSDALNVFQFWKQGSDIIAPSGGSFVPIDAYPSGRFIRPITQHIYEPYAAVISQP